MSPAARTVIRYALLIITAAVLQRAVFAQLRIDGAVPDALLVLAVAAGIVSGTERGATVGFFSGLALDLMLTTPFGLGAVCYLAAGATAGVLETSLVRSARWLTVVIAAVSSVVGVVLYALLGTLLGQAEMLGRHLLVVMAVVAVSSAILVLPVRAGLSLGRQGLRPAPPRHALTPSVCWTGAVVRVLIRLIHLSSPAEA